MDWGKPFQARPWSNPKEMCEGGRSFWYPLCMSWHPMWRPLCCKEKCFKSFVGSILLAYPSSRFQKIHQQVWPVPKDGETHTKGWNSFTPLGGSWAIWKVGHGLCWNYRSTIWTKEAYHSLHWLPDKLGWSKSSEGSNQRKRSKIYEGEFVLQIWISQRNSYWSRITVHLSPHWEYFKETQD